MPLYLGKTPIGGTEVTLTPNGTKSITENGTHDVTQYASVDVNVAGGGGVETCTVKLTITDDNGHTGAGIYYIDENYNIVFIPSTRFNTTTTTISCIKGSLVYIYRMIAASGWGYLTWTTETITHIKEGVLVIFGDGEISY